MCENIYSHSYSNIKILNFNFKFINKTDPPIFSWKALIKKQLKLYEIAFPIEIANRIYIVN